METLAELEDEILTIIDDESFSLANVTGYLNKAMKEISGRFLLPELQTNANVVTTALNYVALPTTFQRNLFYCYSTTQSREIPIMSDFRHILRDVSVIDQGGNVFAVAVRGSNLHYQRIPSVFETLQIHFYKKPTELSTASTAGTPSCIPDHLVRPLLVNYVCKEIFSLIEQDQSGARPNRDFHYSLYQEALADLSLFLGPEPSFAPGMGAGIDWGLEAYGGY